MKIIVSQTTDTDTQGRVWTSTKYDDGSGSALAGMGFAISGVGDDQMPPKPKTGVLLVNYAMANLLDLEATVDAAVAQAKKKLAPGTVFEIRAMPFPQYGVMVDYARRVLTIREQIEEWGIAWIEVAASNKAAFRVKVPQAEIDPEVGVLVIARQVA